ncbi:TIGR02679 family protein [Glycomyces paridis]|nr:TIGR02679 family protein [Glycomyces paridis]
MSELGPEWQRILKAAAAAMERESATFSISEPGTAERHLISGITGKHRLAAAKTIRLPIADLDSYVQLAFAKNLTALILSELGIEIGAARRRRAERAAAIDRITADATGSRLAEFEWFHAWLTALRANGVLAELADSSTGLGALIAVLEALPAADEPLPVISERLLGDTKALASGRARTMLLRALAAWREVEYPVDSESERELLEWTGIVSDDIASQVLVLNLPIEGGPVGDWMRAARGIPFRLTLQQLRREPVTVAAPVIHVVENPSIVRAATDALGADCPPLVCSEGVPSAALYRLLGAAPGARIRWRADFDWTGLRIVRRGLERFPNAEPWRMFTTDYRTGTPGIALRGNPTEAPWDPALSPAMETQGTAVMEESLLPALLNDLRTGDPGSARQ